MPRLNVLLLLAATIVSTLCYSRAERNPYSRYLSQVMEIIDERSLEQVPRQSLFNGAMGGIVAALHDAGDDYSNFVNEEDTARFEEELEQHFGGIGIHIQLWNEDREPSTEGTLTVVRPPLPNSPAAAAGIRVYDQVLAIDGVSLEGLDLDAIMRKMRGEVDTPVTLRLRHLGETTTHEVTITRADIRLPSVLGEIPLKDGGWDYRMATDPRIGHLRVVGFGAETAAEVEQAVRQMMAAGVEGIILDLRDNPGGSLDAAVDVCALFLESDSSIVSIRGRNGRLEREFIANVAGLAVDIPLAVLVNEGSASASEIVAACLQDNERATVVGQRTWGKGTVQHVLAIEGGRSRFNLTAASYWRPNGRNIHRRPDAVDWGVAPDPGWESLMTPAAERSRVEDRFRRDVPPGAMPEESQDRPGPPRPALDPPLDLAVDCLQQKLGK